jgi:hypothetical protein
VAGTRLGAAVAVAAGLAGDLAARLPAGLAPPVDLQQHSVNFALVQARHFQSRMPNCTKKDNPGRPATAGQQTTNAASYNEARTQLELRQHAALSLGLACSHLPACAVQHLSATQDRQAKGVSEVTSFRNCCGDGLVN